MNERRELSLNLEKSKLRSLLALLASASESCP